MIDYKTIKQNTQQDVVDIVEANPCCTEKFIHYGLGVKPGYESDKKHFDLVRRALYSGKINRIKVKIKGVDKRKVYRYYVGSFEQFCK